MTTATLTPLDFSRGERVGRRAFRKQILRKQSITYKGQKIDFDDPLLKELVRNFNKGAYDQVPFQFADGKNQHNEDPRNFSGELVSVELTNDGIDGIFDLTSDGIKAVKRNPKLGVSARIMDAVEHADGRKFGRSIRHVLATMNPRITGMQPWQAIDLSEEEETEVVDLTAETIQERNTMATKTKAKAKTAKVRRSSTGVVSVKTATGTTEVDLSALSDEEFQGLIDLAVEAGEDEDTNDEVVDVTDELEDEDDEDEEDDDEDSDDEDEEEDDDEDDEETDLAIPDAFKKNIKGKKGKAPEAGVDEKVKGNLTKKVVTKRKKGKKVAPPAFVSADLSILDRAAANEWKRERRGFVRDGVPPYMLDLAEPILSKRETVMVDLSEDESVDASGIVRDMLEAARGYIEIKPEIGHSVDLSNEDAETNPATALSEAWDKEYGSA